jgi:hypothetical protein
VPYGTGFNINQLFLKGNKMFPFKNAVVLDTYENAELMYTYQVVEDDDVYKVWKSTGPLRGGYIINKDGFESIIDAMEALVNYVKAGE